MEAKIRYLFVLLLPGVFCCATGVSGYTKDIESLSKKQAAEDLDQLVKNLLAIHPEPFARCERQTFYQQLGRVKDGLEKRNPRKKFNMDIAKLLAGLNDYRTRAKPAMDFLEAAERGEVFFPVKLRYDSRAGLAADGFLPGFKNGNLYRGAAVKSVNAVDGETLISEMAGYCPHRNAFLSKVAAAEDFISLYWYMYGEKENFRIEYTDHNGETVSESVKACKLKTDGVHYIPNIVGPKWSYEIHNDIAGRRVCHFRAKTFAIVDDTKHKYGYTLDKFQTFLADMFERAANKNVELLVIDVRENQLGDESLVWELIGNLTAKPVEPYKLSWRYSELYQKNMLVYGLIMKNSPSFLHLENFLKLSDHRPVPFDPQRLDGETWQRPEYTRIPTGKKGYEGSVVVLTGNVTASAASMLGGVVKDSGIGITAGAETGAAETYYAKPVPVFLRNSGVVFTVPSAKFQRNESAKPDKGILPDIEIDTALPAEQLLVRIVNEIGQLKKEGLD